jgi:DNA/RNA-binding domain of Phe-tRNA-synthetase-like protein
VICDEVNLIAIYPYRDSDLTKIDDSSKSILLISCGVPNIEPQQLKDAIDLAVEYILRYCP